MGGVDVLSVNGLLWALFLLVLKDPWRDFRYVTGSGWRGEVGVGKEEVGTGLPAITGNGEVKEQRTSLGTVATNGVDGADNGRSGPGEPYPSSFLARISLSLIHI